MKRILLSFTLVCALAVPVLAKMAPPPALPLRIAVADTVLLGKATSFGPRLIKAEMFPGDDREFQTATVEVSETILGTKTKQIQVGLVHSPRSGRFPTARVALNQDAILILKKHPTKKDLFVIENYYDVVSKQENPEFASQLAEVRRGARLLADPMTSLVSKDAGERYLTAAMLLTRNQQARTGSKLEAVPANQSKLVLEALADADWSDRNAYGWTMNPRFLFSSLGLTAKDGWTPPGDASKFADAAKKWLKANAASHRLQRHVVPTKTEPEPAPGK